MFRWMTMCCTAVVVLAAGLSQVRAQPRDATLAVVMTNDATANQIKVYDAGTSKLLQTLSTQGQGAAGGNARGVRQLDGEMVAAVNNGSNSVAVFRRTGKGLHFERLVTTTSAPVSIDFGNGHMYVAGETTVDSFVLHHDSVGSRDGSVALELAGGGVPPSGATAQVGVADDRHLLVTIKTDPTPGTVDVVGLDDDGAISGAAATAVSAPAGTLTPFGFSIYPDGSAVITLAHTNQLGLFRDSAFRTVVALGQAAPCWTTRVGKYVFTANTGSHTITRVVGTGSNVFSDSAIAASIATGGAPSDIDAAAGVLGVIDHGARQSHLSLFSYNAFGELAASGAPITVGVPNANGVAIVPAKERP